MFGLEDQQRKKPVEQFLFDWEKELKNPLKYRQFRQKMEQRIQKLKEALREGEAHSEFERFSLLLQGYGALIKVAIRVAESKKK